MQIGGGVDLVTHWGYGTVDQGLLDALIVHNEQAFMGERQIIHAMSLTSGFVWSAWQHEKMNKG